jgi:hypothetical protein
VEQHGYAATSLFISPYVNATVQFLCFNFLPVTASNF